MKLDSIWYRNRVKSAEIADGKSLHPLAILLLPFSLIFFLLITIRRWLYRAGLLKTSYFKPPVIIVGNLAVGGTGKTPFVIALTNFLQTEGYKPGIVSRGVGGKRHRRPHLVSHDDSPVAVGDEALLLVRKTQSPVVIGINRAEAVNNLLARTDCNVVISDDGLQHYRLDRDIEIAMIDSTRRLGNQCLLPAGPLREPKSRLKSVDFVVVNGGDESVDDYIMMHDSHEFVSVRNPDHVVSFSEFPCEPIHAVAAIGHPQQFFLTLKNIGFKDMMVHVFRDHHLYKPHELDFGDDMPIIMTEKDAVKCHQFADERFWFLRVTSKMSRGLEQALLKKLQGIAAAPSHSLL